LVLPYADADNSVAGSNDLLSALDTLSAHLICSAERLTEPLDG
jgi:hypothetical protein